MVRFAFTAGIGSFLAAAFVVFKLVSLSNFCVDFEGVGAKKRIAEKELS